MTRNTQNTMSCLLTVGLLAALAGTAQGQDVGRGGTEIDVGAGSNLITLNLKNTTGVRAEDITIAIYGGDVPDIETVDVLGTNKDKVDDNGDGDLDADETDNNADPAGTVVKTILDGTSVANNGSINVNITLSGNTPPGTKIKVKFSNLNNGKHWDLMAVADFGADNFGFFLPVTPGAPQMVTTLVHDNDDWIYDIVLPVWPENPIIDIQLPDEFGDSFVFPGENEWIVQLVPPLPPQQPLDLYFETQFPIFDQFESFEQPIFIFVGPPPCRADINEDGVVNTLDYIEFLNLWTVQHPAADWNNDGVVNTLDFLAFQNDWVAGC
ncbi:MAG: GC-type dockerin domain-anchored protein [Planctomycetota bacterium]|nr:GC-type dockerin domain-anchored protein [Planctomycetota bacterium]